MPGPLTIDWKPLDFSGMEQIPLLYQAARKSAAQEESLRQNAETQRMYAANQDRKLSADLARADWEQKHKLEREQHQDEIATSTALPTIMRIAARDPGMAGAMGKPYGVSFQQQTETQMPVDRMSPSGADVAQFLTSGGTKATPTAADMAASQPLQGPTPAGPSLAEVPDPEAPAPGLDIDAETAAREKMLPTTRHVYGSVQGQRFEVKPQTETPFGEPEYDDMYQRLLAENPDVPPLKLRAEVAKVRSQNLGASGRHDALEETKRYHTGELGLGGQRITQSDTNSRRGAWAEIEAAKIRAAAMGGGEGMPDPKVLNAYYGQSNRAFTRSGAKIDASGNRLHDRMAAELEQAGTNPYNAQTILHNLAGLSLSTGTGTARVLKSAIEDLQHALPWYEDAKNTLKRGFVGGNTDYVQQKMGDIAHLLRQLGHEQAMGDFRSWAATAGPNSQFGANPTIRPQTFDESESVGRALGLSEEEVVSILGEPGLPGGGSPPGPAPAPRRAPAQHGAPPAPARQPAPAAPAGPAAPGAGSTGLPIGTRKPGPDGVMREKTATGWVPVK